QGQVGAADKGVQPGAFEVVARQVEVDDAGQVGGAGQRPHAADADVTVAQVQPTQPGQKGTGRQALSPCRAGGCPGEVEVFDAGQGVPLRDALEGGLRQGRPREVESLQLQALVAQRLLNRLPGEVDAAEVEDAQAWRLVRTEEPERFRPRCGAADVEFFDPRQVRRAQQRQHLLVVGPSAGQAEAAQPLQLRSGSDLGRIDVGLVEAEELQIANGQLREQLLGVTEELANAQFDRLDETSNEPQLRAEFLQRSQPGVAVQLQEFLFALLQRPLPRIVGC